LNGEAFDRCIRCAAPLQPLAAGAQVLGEQLGARLDARKLWGTKVIVGLTLLVFAGQMAALLRSGGSIRLLGWPSGELMRFGAMHISIEETLEQPYRLLTAVFVHIGILHVVMNMISLVNIGRVVEPAVGSARFVVAYLVSGVLGFAANLGLLAIGSALPVMHSGLAEKIVHAVFPREGLTPTLTAGASGAVFGAMGLILGWLVRKRDRRWRSFAVQAVFYALVLNLLGIGINNGAHIGGLLAGAAFGFVYAGNPRPRSQLAANAGAVLGLALSIVSLLLAQSAAGWGKRPVLGALDRPAACQGIVLPAGSVQQIASGPPSGPARFAPAGDAS
jgi:membrane associated rhomboid family serine protease